MRNDEEFLRQIAMQEIVCPCGEDCLDQKGAWKREPKEKASQKTGNPLISKHKKLEGLFECVASYVLTLHERWLKNPVVRIKLAKTHGAMAGVDAWIRMGGRANLDESFQKVMEKLKFYRYSQPAEVREAASDLFGVIWREVIVLLKARKP